jgi:diacylglycerol kinase (ATP)
MNRPFQFRGRIGSFRRAFLGLWTMLRSQRNAWIRACATFLATAIALYFGLSRAEWWWSVLAIMAVWTAEALKTAFKILADVSSPDFHPLVRKSRDLAAGAVLISALGSALIGVIVLGPRVLEMMK